MLGGIPDSVVNVALVTGILGLWFASVKVMAKRAADQYDADRKHFETEIEKLKEEVRQHTALLMELKGTVNSESWGLVVVVKKLSTNVEKLTTSVDRMEVLVTEKFRG